MGSFMRDEAIRVLVEGQVTKAVRAAQQVELVTEHFLDVGLPSKGITYVREVRKYPTGYPVAFESVQSTTVTDLLTKILIALESLGVEVYHEPAKPAVWGLRNKPAPVVESEQGAEPKS